MSSNEPIADKLAYLPASPGVYLMKDAHGKVLYVGKSAILKNRVRSYFHSTDRMEAKTCALVAETVDIEVIQTDTEAEAFLLEDSLIKRHQPRFNIRLRDDKRYPYLKITNEPFPRVVIVRRRQPDGARYFGPYTNAKAMRSTLKLAQKLFPIRTCTLALPLKTPRRPCLNYHIDRCLGPCAALVSEEEYAKEIDGATMLFEGRLAGLAIRLRARMEEAASAERFEQAASIRNQLTGLTRTLERQSVALSDLVDRDVIGIAIEGDRACAEVFLVRGGRVSGREAFHLRAPGDPSEKEVLSAFLSQYYAKASTIPPEILLSTDPEEPAAVSSWLSSQRGKRVRLKVPQRGEKRRLVEMACDNARLSLKGEKVGAIDREKKAAALSELAETLCLSAFPHRIEAFDISNTQGGEATGSMVVFESGRPRRDAYRRFKVRISGKPDDVAMMAEILRRRFRRGLAEISDPAVSRGKFSEFPDLLMIDGGKGQLNAALSVLRELEIEGVEAISLAKRHETLYRPDEAEPIRFPSESKALLLLRQIRDEAHRFAITYHRRLRSRHSLASRLDEIPGIGPKRKQSLIKAFGSVERISHASIEDVVRETSLPRTVAEKLMARLKA